MNRNLLLSFVAISFVGISVNASAQVSALYLTEFSTTRSFIVQGGAVIGTFNRANANDNAMAITNTIKTYSRNTSSSGNQYDLSGNFIGTYGNTNPGFSDPYDGATDGTTNWSVAHNDFTAPQFAVIQANSDWTGGFRAWAPVDRSSGITYDATDNSLWIAKNVGGSDGIMHYTTSGTLLGGFSFAFLSGAGYGLAHDSADNTLWLTGGFGTAGTLRQYSKTGSLLNTLTVAGLAGTNIMGAEFSAVPEPASMAALGLGVAALLRRRRR